MSSAASEANAKCPRCGYDQRGVIESWTSRCELQSTCTECGLRIEWADVLSPKRQRPRWCVEYAVSVRQTVWRTFTSAIVPWWPWHMWRSLKLTDPPQWTPLLRASAVTVALVVVLAYVSIQITAGLSRLHLRPGNATNVKWTDVCWRAIFMPLSNASPGTINSALGASPFPPPIDWTRYYIRSSAWREMHISRQVIGIAFDVLLVAFSSCALLALPISRKRAKVRWSHVWRVMMYGLSLVLPALLLVDVAIVVRATESRWDAPMTKMILEFALVFSNIIVPIMIALYWQAAIKRYLRMEHSVSVTLSIYLIGVGMAIAVLFYTTGRLAPTELWRWIVSAMA